MSDATDFDLNRLIKGISQTLPKPGPDVTPPDSPLYYRLRGRYLDAALQRRVHQFLSPPYAVKNLDFKTVDRYAESIGYSRWHPRESPQNDVKVAAGLIADPFNFGGESKRLSPSNKQPPVPTHYSPGATGYTNFYWRLYQRRRSFLTDTIPALAGSDKKYIACTWITWTIDNAPHGEHLQTSFAAMPFLCALLDTRNPELRDDPSLDALSKPIDTIIASARRLLGSLD